MQALPTLQLSCGVLEWLLLLHLTCLTSAFLPLLCRQNVVLYAGSAEDRRLIREYEFFYPKHRVCVRGRGGSWVYQLLLHAHMQKPVPEPHV